MRRPVVLALLVCLLTACDPASAPTSPSGGGGSDGSVVGTMDGGTGLDASMTVTDAAAPPPPPAGGGLAAILDATTYAEMFPNRNALYTYEAFVAAAAYYPAFVSEGTTEQRKRELAAFLANIAHETTGGWDTAPGGRYAWGLYFTQEVGCEAGACTGYCDPTNAQYPCKAGKTYHGRGPIQLSWNYNYGPMGATLGVDLLSDPDALIRDGVLAFRSAIWFWMTEQSPKPSCHAVMTGQFTPSPADVTANRLPGFGLTIDIINGGIECGWARSASVSDRLGFYARFTTILGVSQGDHLDCDTMQSY
ncbi:MAG: chitinase [Polyangiales bacterium]